MTPTWFVQRYPNEQAVRGSRDFDLLEDFRFGVMEVEQASYGGVVVGWMSRELIRRGIPA